MPLGRVARSSRDYYTVLLDDDEREVRLAGALRHRAASAADLPVTGDWVQVREGVVEAVLPRKTRIWRRAAGTREQEQVLASNVDLVLIVCGLDGDYNPRRIGRYVVVARESGARAGVVLNESDLCFEVEERLEEIRAIAERRSGDCGKQAAARAARRGSSRCSILDRRWCCWAPPARESRAS